MTAETILPLNGGTHGPPLLPEQRFIATLLARVLQLHVCLLVMLVTRSLQHCLAPGMAGLM